MNAPDTSPSLDLQAYADIQEAGCRFFQFLEQSLQATLFDRCVRHRNGILLRHLVDNMIDSAQLPSHLVTSSFSAQADLLSVLLRLDAAHKSPTHSTRHSSQQRGKQANHHADNSPSSSSASSYADLVLRINIQAPDRILASIAAQLEYTTRQVQHKMKGCQGDSNDSNNSFSHALDGGSSCDAGEGDLSMHALMQSATSASRLLVAMVTDPLWRATLSLGAPFATETSSLGDNSRGVVRALVVLSDLLGKGVHGGSDEERVGECLDDVDDGGAVWKVLLSRIQVTLSFVLQFSHPARLYTMQLSCDRDLALLPRCVAVLRDSLQMLTRPVPSLRQGLAPGQGLGTRR